MRPAFPAATRAYAIASAAIVLLMFPWFVVSFGVVRQHPLELRARTDVVEVSFGTGEWLPARGIAAARLITAIPPGMRVCYRFASGDVRCGEVRNIAEAPSQTAARTVTAILALAFALAGAILAVIGVDRRAHAAAGMLAAIGLLFGAGFLEPTLVAIGDLGLELGVIVLWSWFPRYAGLVCMLLFAREFPATLPRSRVTTVLVAMVTFLVVAATAITGIAHVPGLLERTSLPAQRMFISLVLLTQKLVYAGTALATIVLVMRQRKHALTQAGQLRRRGRMVAAGLAFGFVPPMALIVLQVLFRLTLDRQMIPYPLVSTSFLTLLAIPAAVMAAVMAKRIDSFRILARRALLFAVADRVVPILAVAPLVAIALLLYVNHDRSMQAVVEEHRLAFVVMVVAAVALFAFAGRMRRAVQGYFHRDEAATRERLASLPSHIAQADTVESVADVFEREIEAAFRPETFALLVHDERENAFRAVGRELPIVSATAAIGVELGRARAPLHTSELFSRKVSEVNRHWIALARAELLVPLLASDQQLLGILAVGEKESELPYDDAEKALLMAAASAAALQIENQRLRGRAPRAAPASRSDDDAALVCPMCRRYQSAAAASRCPVDDAELVETDVPYVLAGKYRFEERLGAGGMGVVYRARDLELERDVAVKTLPRLSAETASRLRREARTAANLWHPNLATVFAVESWRGVPMLILEYLDDGTLAERLSRGPVPVETIVRCGVAIAGALGHAHARTILHRDVKPSNIGFSRNSGAKLLDFGLARILEENDVEVESLGGSSPTMTSGLVGTPAYLSPEAILGKAPHPDFDLWSLSLTLYEALTGKNPFVGPTLTATMNAILATPIPDPREVRGDCPASLSQFLVASLSRRREDRPRTAAEFAGRLGEAEIRNTGVSPA